MEALQVNVCQLRAATGSNPILSKVFRYIEASTDTLMATAIFDRSLELTMEKGYLFWVITPGADPGIYRGGGGS